MELEGQHEQALVGIEADRAVVNRDGHRGLEGENENEAVMERAAALRPVQVGRRASAEAYDVVRQREGGRAFSMERPERRRQQIGELVEREDPRVTCF